MKFKELPKKWKTIIVSLSVSSVLLIVSLVVYVMNTLGSLIHVMLG